MKEDSVAQFSAEREPESTARSNKTPPGKARGAVRSAVIWGAALFAAATACHPPSPDRNHTMPPTEDEAADDPRAAEREAMVAAFARLRPGMADPRVLAAMRLTPRHRFVPAEFRDQAYLDQPLPIGHGQTISQPSLVAFMTEQLAPEPADRILEIGTGSGYQAAVLSPLVARVYTIEIVEPLAERARQTLNLLGYDNVLTRTGDGYQGWPEEAPFDAILVTCAPDDIPRALITQLREGGRMVIPVGPPNAVQELYLLEKRGGKIERRAILPVRFVPMTGGKDTPRARGADGGLR